MVLLRLGALPDDALAAAARFHANELPKVRAMLSGKDLAIVFPPADHTHLAWRLAAVQGLAREHAPIRVNGVESDDEVEIAAACGYLAQAEGVTGQYLPLDGAGAGEVIG